MRMTPPKRIVAGLLLGLVAGASAAPSPPGPPRDPAEGGGALLAIGDPPPRQPLPRARPITSSATVNTPVCLGFAPDGKAAYVLSTNNDPAIAEWYLMVRFVGDGVGGAELTKLARTRSRRAARAAFAPLVRPINALIRDRKLVACETTRARPGKPLEVTVRGIRTRISVDGDTLIIAPAGRPRVTRVEGEAGRLTLAAAYTAPTLPGIVVMMQNHLGDGMVAYREQLILLE